MLLHPLQSSRFLLQIYRPLSSFATNENGFFKEKICGLIRVGALILSAFIGLLVIPNVPKCEAKNQKGINMKPAQNVNVSSKCENFFV